MRESRGLNTLEKKFEVICKGQDEHFAGKIEVIYGRVWALESDLIYRGQVWDIFWGEKLR